MINSKRYGAKVKINKLQDGDITFYVTFKVGKKKKVISVGKKSNGWNEKKAFQQRAKLMDKAKFGVGIHADVITFGEIAVEYFEWAEIHNRSHLKSLQNYNKHLEDKFDKKIVSALNDRDITKLQKSLTEDKLSNSTVNIIVGIITKIIGFGVRKGIIEHSPFKDVQKLKVDNNRDRFLTKKEIDKLLKNIEKNRDLYLFVLLSINVGARAESTLNFKMSDIDFESEKIKVFDFKRNMSYKNPLNGRLKKELEQIDHNGFIVGSGIKYSYHKLYLKLKPVLDALFNVGIDKDDRKGRVVIHTLRHTFASHLALFNTPLQNIKELMNHADINMTLKYAHLMPNAGAKYVNKLYSESE